MYSFLFVSTTKAVRAPVLYIFPSAVGSRAYLPGKTVQLAQTDPAHTLSMPLKFFLFFFSFVSVQSVREPFSTFLLMSFFGHTIWTHFENVLSHFWASERSFEHFDDLPAEMKCLLFDFWSEHTVWKYCSPSKLCAEFLWHGQDYMADPKSSNNLVGLLSNKIPTSHYQ